MVRFDCLVCDVSSGVTNHVRLHSIRYGIEAVGSRIYVQRTSLLILFGSASTLQRPDPIGRVIGDVVCPGRAGTLLGNSQPVRNAWVLVRVQKSPGDERGVRENVVVAGVGVNARGDTGQKVEAKVEGIGGIGSNVNKYLGQ